MKNYILIFATVCAFFYLAGAFISVSFNIAEWALLTRIMVVFLAPIAGGIAVVIYDELK